MSSRPSSPRRHIAIWAALFATAGFAFVASAKVQSLHEAAKEGGVAAFQQNVCSFLAPTED